MSKKTFEKTNITAETLSAELKDFRATGRKAVRRAQEFIICGLGIYLNTGNTEPLLRIYKACTIDSGMDKRTMLGFIKAHANVKLEHEGKKNAKFIKRGKGGMVVKAIAGWWFDHAPSDKLPTPAMDVSKAVDTFIKRIQREMKEHHVTNEVQAQAVLNYMRKCTVCNTQESIAPEKAVATA